MRTDAARLGEVHGVVRAMVDDTVPRHGIGGDLDALSRPVVDADSGKGNDEAGEGEDDGSGAGCWSKKAGQSGKQVRRCTPNTVTTVHLRQRKKWGRWRELLPQAASRAVARPEDKNMANFASRSRARQGFTRTPWIAGGTPQDENRATLCRT